MRLCNISAVYCRFQQKIIQPIRKGILLITRPWILKPSSKPKLFALRPVSNDANQNPAKDDDQTPNPSTKKKRHRLPSMRAFEITATDRITFPALTIECITLYLSTVIDGQECNTPMSPSV